MPLAAASVSTNIFTTPVVIALLVGMIIGFIITRKVG